MIRAWGPLRRPQRNWSSSGIGGLPLPASPKYDPNFNGFSTHIVGFGGGARRAEGAKAHAHESVQCPSHLAGAGAQEAG